MKRLTIVFTFVLTTMASQALLCQILTTSNHPIVVINTGGVTIPDEPKIDATMGIIYNGGGATNKVGDPFNHYDGSIGIETRGNSTQGFEKKTYSLELRDAANNDLSADLLGMGSEEDWILHAMVIDKSQVRIPMSFYLSQQMGHYASEWKYVELILNNEYRGLYILTEKIKQGKDRVNIAKLDEDDLSGDSLTGGFILRIDWLEDIEEKDGFESAYESQGKRPMFFQWYYPKASKIKPQQVTYIREWMNEFEDAVFSNDYFNNKGRRYTDYIDLNSFTDFLLINELSKNSDGYKLSTYINKEKDSKGGKLVAGPIWDFDQTYGMSTVCSNDDYTGWTYLQNQNHCEDLESMPMWWQAMMADTLFQNSLKCRWEKFRKSFLHKDSINNWINMDTSFISEAIERNFIVWDDFIGNSIWSEPTPIPQSYSEEIDYLKNWISNRINWLDANIPGVCSLTTSVSQNNNEDQAIKIYPNPTDDKITVEAEGVIMIEVISIDGKTLLVTGLKEISLSKYQEGIYFIKVTTKTQTVTKSVVKLF